MERKTLGVLSVIIAAGAVMRPVTPQFTAQAASTPGRSVQVPTYEPVVCDDSKREGPWEALQQTIGDGQDQTSVSTRIGDANPDQWNLLPPGTSVRFLVVSVSDPEESHLALNFDRVIESVIWSVGDSGYTFERYWIPWESESGNGGVTQPDQACRERLKDRRRKEPGLIVFRSKAFTEPDQSHLLMVWLVGETPTAGIDKTQLSNVFAHAKSLQARSASPRVSINLPIVGPNFSGSLHPLAAYLPGLLRQYQATKVSIVTGAVTNLREIEKFGSAVTDVPFESTIENDFRASRLFFQYVLNEQELASHSWFVKGEIAILSENETVYGDLEIVPESDSHEWLLLRYPREIARLRNATSPGSTESRQPQSPSQNGVPLILGDAVSPDRKLVGTENIATFSEQQSPAAQQASLLSIAATLRRERAAYAGVIATDIRDALFLTRFLRTSNPDVRVFTFDSDLLFMREAETAPLEGSLAITTYPLFSRNQHWTQHQSDRKMPQREQFTSRYAEAVYNACKRALAMGKVDSPPAGAILQAQPSYLEYESPFTEGRSDAPPLWLTVVGRDGYWPVALLDDGVDRAASRLPKSTITPLPHPRADQSKNEGLHPEPPSRAWWLLFWLALLFCLLHTVYVTYLMLLPESEGEGKRWFGWNALGGIFSVYPDERPTEREQPFLLAATISLLSSLVLFSWPMSHFLGFKWALVHFRIALACALFLTLLGIWLTLRRTPYWFAVVFAWALAVSFLSLWIWLIERGNYKSGYFMAYRALYLGNGVSPGIPIVLLAAAFYGWAWVHLNRETSAKGARDARRRTTGVLGPEDQVAGLPVLINEMDSEIEDIMAWRIRIPALIFLALWFLVLWPLTTLRSVEHYLYDVLYTVVLMALYWCIALVSVQFFRCWRQFRAVLETLERHPIRNAFSRLPKEISWIPLVSMSPPRNLFVSGRTLNCLQGIMGLLTPINPDSALELSKEQFDPRSPLARLRPVHKEIESNAEALNNRLSADGKVDSSAYADLQSNFEKARLLIFHHLSHTAWLKGSSDSLRAEEARRKAKALSDDDRLLILEEEYIALRLLMYIRYVLRQLRNLLGFMMGGFIVSVISMNSYPFQAHRWIGLSSFLALLAIGTVVAIVLAQMDKDAILSRITDTKENQLGKTFFIRLAQYGALPLLTVLSGFFPAINRALLSWLQPALEALK